MTKGKGEGSKKKAKVNNIMLSCSICKGRDHGWCYGVFNMKADFIHICGRSEIQNDTVCTSEEIKIWYLTNFKSEAD